MTSPDVDPDVVRTWDEAGGLAQSPLIVLETLEQILDELGVGSGPVTASPLGNGHSNVTYLLERGAERVVLRRPPRPPYPESAHDVLREARLVAALDGCGLPVPTVHAMVEDPTLLGAPFVILEFVAGCVVGEAVPAELAGRQDARRIAEGVVGALADIHAIDVSQPPLATLGKPTGYLERQIRRFSGIWADVATRAIPAVEQVADWLGVNLPATTQTTLVHGDYRLGNMLFAHDSPARLVAVLDWELATLGDPLVDLGYLCATWAEPDDEDNPMLALSSATRTAGFPSRANLAACYADQTGRDILQLGWYEVLALWKAAVFLEASYARFRAGTTSDPYFATLADGVPRLAAAAVQRIAELENSVALR